MNQPTHNRLSVKLSPLPLRIIFLILLTTFLIFDLATTGCKNPESVAFKATGSVVLSVDTGMNIWGDYVRSGKATSAQIAAVRTAYGKYLAVLSMEKASVIAAHAGTSTNGLSTALAVVSASSIELMNLIETFTQKAPTP